MGWLSRNKRPAEPSGGQTPDSPTTPDTSAGPAPSGPEPGMPTQSTAQPYAVPPAPAQPAPGQAAPAPAAPEPAAPAQPATAQPPTTGERPQAAQAPQGAPPAQAAQAPQGAPPAHAPGSRSPMGTYGPQVSITRFDTAPAELEWQLPLNGELYRLIPGSDRPDYSLLVLDRPLHFYPKKDFDLSRVEPEMQVQDRKGRPMVRVHAMLLCARFVGQQLHPGMVDLAVNLAYVIDNSLARDAEVDFGKIEFAAVGFLSEGHAPRPEPSAHGEREGRSGDALEDSLEDVLDELARQLHAGIVAKRSARVQKLTASLRVSRDHRLTGLSGNADGQAPVPAEETFIELNDTLTRLEGFGEQGRVAGVTLHVIDGVISHEVTATHGEP